MQFQLSPWLSPESISVCRAQICWEMFVCTCTHVVIHTQTRDPQIGWNRAPQEDRSEHSDQVQALGTQSLAYLSPQSPFFSMFLFPDIP